MFQAVEDELPTENRLVTSSGSNLTLNESISGDGFEDTAQPQQFGDYELLERVGAGAMGIVYRARQKSTDRIVALKLIRREQLEALSEGARKNWLDRFRAEAQMAARLDHDHVVSVFEVGERNGTLFYSMQFVPGPSLAQVVREGPMENRRAARIMHSVALAVDHAHRQGVLHRDLKPQNILVRRDSNTSSQSTAAWSTDETELSLTGTERVFVADFGLAKCLEAGMPGITQTGEVIGSPSYMSPEQAQDASRCTAASDIYSLGATLYDLLTARPPFRAYSALETLRQVIEQEPVAPRDLNPAIDLDVQTITLKALAKEPSRRYATAADLADDLQRYLDDKPINARPIGLLGRSARWCRRNPLVTTLAAGAAGLLLVAAVGSSIYSFRSRELADRETRARTEAESYFRTTLNVIDEMLVTVGQEPFQRLSQTERLSEDLSRKALRLYQALLWSKPSNRPLQIELARTHQRVANLYARLGEHRNAAQAYGTAIREFSELRIIDAFPDNVTYRYEWVNSHCRLGDALTELGLLDEAKLNFERADQLLDQWLAEFPKQAPRLPQFQSLRGRVLAGLSYVYSQNKEFTAALGFVERAIDSQSEAARLDPETAEFLEQLELQRALRISIQQQMQPR